MTPAPGTVEIPERYWSASMFRGLDERARARLARYAVPASAAPGELVQRQSPHADIDHGMLLLVLDGVVRTFVESAERQVTFRYSTTGDVIGLCAMLHPSRTPIFAQTVTAAEFARVPAKVVEELALEDAQVAQVILDEILAVQNNSVDHLVQNMFQPVKVRVAAHLLELSDAIGEGRALEISHQVIADAIGTVREVVSRAIADLTAQGAIARSGQGLAVVDRAALAALVAADDQSH